VRAIFFGTPAFAVPSLDALTASADVVGVVCQPDRPVGRGLTLTPPPVKARAQELGLPVLQPTKLRTGEFAAWVRAQGADLALVVAYGRILPKDVLSSTRLGFVNVHASLLPRYRGAAPITWAVVNGDAETGITLMLLDEGMDTGDMLSTSRTPIGPDETAGELSDRLALLGAEIVRAQLSPFVRGELPRVPQRSDQATLAPMLEKKDGRVDWSAAGLAVHNRIRGMSPWPGAFTQLETKTVKLLESRFVGLTRSEPVTPGTVLVADKSRVLVASGPEGHDAVELVRVQLEGRKPVTASDWVKGRGVHEGDVLGASASPAHPRDLS